MVIRAGKANAEANNLTLWLRNETLTAMAYDTLQNYSGIILTRINGGLTVSVSTGITYRELRCVLLMTCYYYQLMTTCSLSVH